MGKSTSADRDLSVGLVRSGLVALTVVGVALSTGTGDSAACVPYQATLSSSMVGGPPVHLGNDEATHGEQEIAIGPQSAGRLASALLPTLPVTSVPTIPIIETLVSQTPELPIPTEELPGLATVPPVVSSPVAEPSTIPTPTVTPMPSETGQSRQRLLLLGGLGVALLCGGGILTGLLLLLFLRRGERKAAPPDLPSAPLPEGQPVLTTAGVDPIMLPPGVTTIGRSEENDIIIEGRQASRYHARIECAGGVCTIEDLQSSNGTLVNGERVSRAVLASGDRLQIGGVQMTYRSPEVEMPHIWLEIGQEQYTVSTRSLTIGRSRENDVQLADPLASRTHARLELMEGTRVLIDLNSANGTFVNGQRVQHHPLSDGDEIRIGSSLITFRRRSRG